MSTQETFDLCVLSVEGIGQFLQINGLNCEKLMRISGLLESLRSNIDTFPSADIASYPLQGIHCFVIIENRYYRAKIIKTDQCNAEIFLIDYQKTTCVDRRCLKFPPQTGTHRSFVSILQDPPDIRTYILANIRSETIAWTKEQIDYLNGYLHGKIGATTEIAENEQNVFVKMVVDGQDLGNDLVMKRLAIPTPEENYSTMNQGYQHAYQTVPPGFVPQMKTIQNHQVPPSMSPVPMAHQMPNATQAMPTQPHQVPYMRDYASPANSSVSASPVLYPTQNYGQTPPSNQYQQQAPPMVNLPARNPAYHPYHSSRPINIQTAVPPPYNPLPPTKTDHCKSRVLEPGKKYQVTVSVVQDGPKLFSIQFNELTEALGKLLLQIQTSELIPLKEQPYPGKLCLAFHRFDSTFLRAIILDFPVDKVKVYYVDFGYRDELNIDEIFEIPYNVLVDQAYSVRVSLAGSEDWNITPEVNSFFRQYTCDKEFIMEIIDSPEAAFSHHCKLYDEHKDVSTLLVTTFPSLTMAVYEKPLELEVGTKHDVIVSFVENCGKFFVQMNHDSAALNQLMEDIKVYATNAKTLTMDAVQPEMPCIAKYSADQSWYRAEITSRHGAMIKVFYVDYGNDDTLTIDSLRMIDKRLITQLRKQAICCSLVGSENATPDISSEFENYVIEQTKDLVVHQKTTSCNIVELFDKESNSPVSKMLFPKPAPTPANVPVAEATYQVAVHNANQHIERQSRTFAGNNDFHGNEKTAEDQENTFRSAKAFNNQRPANNYGGFDSDRERKNEASIDGDWREARKELRAKNSDFFNKESGNDSGYQRNNRNFESGGDRNTNYRNDRNDGNFQSRKDNRGSWDDRKTESRRNDGNFQSRNDNRGSWDDRKTESRRNDGNSWDKKSSWDNNNDFGSSFQTPEPVTDYAELSRQWTKNDMSGTTNKIIVTWFVNPGKFYCQKQDSQFRRVMEEVQSMYAKRKPIPQSTNLEVGNSVIAVFPEDNAFYRATILKTDSFAGHTVEYVDFGNSRKNIQQNKIYMVEKKLFDLPLVAFECALKNIVPATEDGWPKLTQEMDDCFNKEEYKCTVDSVTEGKCEVFLSCNGVDVSGMLIEKGLAIWQTPQTALQDTQDLSVDPTLLTGQTLRVRLSHVENVDKFYVQFPVADAAEVPNFMTVNNVAALTLSPKLSWMQNQAVECSIQGSAAQETTENDKLKSLVGQDVIITVQEMQNNRFLVNVFDTNGQVVIPTELCNSNISSLIPTPVLLPSEKVQVSHIDHAGSVWLQKFADIDTESALLQNLLDHYNSAGEVVTVHEAKAFCAAQSENDDYWYRASIVEKTQEGVMVHYIDYGNSELIKSEDRIKTLEAQFYTPHQLAIKASLTVQLGKSPEEQAECLNTHLLQKEAFATFYYPVDGAWLVDLVVEDKKISETLAAEGLVEKEIEIQLRPGQVGPLPDGCILVDITHCDSPSQFWIVLRSSADELAQMQKDLQIVAAASAEIETVPDVGSLVFAIFSFDSEWYRAQVIDADEDITTVRFIDYGNTDVVDNKTSKVRVMPEKYTSTPQYSWKCSLDLLPAGDADWTAEAIQRFTDLTEGANEIQALMIAEGVQSTVDVYVDSRSVSATLIVEGHAIKMPQEGELVEDIIEEELDPRAVFVSHFENLGEFWIQHNQNTGDLETISDRLMVANLQPVLESVEKGTMCIAEFPDDKKYYRAEVIEQDGAEISVRYIDYGNSSRVNQVRVMPDDLVTYPTMSKKCCLKMPPSLDSWPEMAHEKFKELSAEGATVFILESTQKEGDTSTSTVELSQSGKSVLCFILDDYQEPESMKMKTGSEEERLPPLGEENEPKVFVSVAHSPDDFWIQLESQVPELENMADLMTDTESFLPLTEFKEDYICTAKFTEDEMWYRAKILSHGEDGTKVLFIDYGNSAVATELKKLPMNIVEILPFSRHCTLVKPSNIESWSEAAISKFIELVAEGQTPFQFEMLDNETHLSIALKLEGQDIVEILAPLGNAKTDEAKTVEGDHNNDQTSEKEPDQQVTPENIPEVEVENVEQASEAVVEKIEETEEIKIEEPQLIEQNLIEEVEQSPVDVVEKMEETTEEITAKEPQMIELNLSEDGEQVSVYVVEEMEETKEASNAQLEVDEAQPNKQNLSEDTPSETVSNLVSEHEKQEFKETVEIIEEVEEAQPIEQNLSEDIPSETVSNLVSEHKQQESKETVEIMEEVEEVEDIASETVLDLISEHEQRESKETVGKIEGTEQASNEEVNVEEKAQPIERNLSEDLLFESISDSVTDHEQHESKEEEENFCDALSGPTECLPETTEIDIEETQLPLQNDNDISKYGSTEDMFHLDLDKNEQSSELVREKAEEETEKNLSNGSAPEVILVADKKVPEAVEDSEKSSIQILSQDDSQVKIVVEGSEGNAKVELIVEKVEEPKNIEISPELENKDDKFKEAAMSLQTFADNCRDLQRVEQENVNEAEMSFSSTAAQFDPNETDKLATLDCTLAPSMSFSEPASSKNNGNAQDKTEEDESNVSTTFEVEEVEKLKIEETFGKSMIHKCNNDSMAEENLAVEKGDSSDSVVSNGRSLVESMSTLDITVKHEQDEGAEQVSVPEGQLEDQIQKEQVKKDEMEPVTKPMENVAQDVSKVQLTYEALEAVLPDDDDDLD